MGKVSHCSCCLLPAQWGSPSRARSLINLEHILRAVINVNAHLSGRLDALADLLSCAACAWMRSVSRIVLGLQVAKAFGDMEAIFTYEGTYEVNALVAGRGITGKAAFKPAPSRQPKYVQA